MYRTNKEGFKDKLFTEPTIEKLILDQYGEWTKRDSVEKRKFTE
jgi:hypothetical protein